MSFKSLDALARAQTPNADEYTVQDAEDEYNRLTGTYDECLAFMDSAPGKYTIRRGNSPVQAIYEYL